MPTTPHEDLPRDASVDKVLADTFQDSTDREYAAIRKEDLAWELAIMGIVLFLGFCLGRLTQ